MKWVTATDLSNWSQAISARTTLPQLVGDLIQAFSDDIDSFRFPSGDKGQVRGFDGFLEARGSPPWVPSGTSIWEFGITAESLGKVQSDLKKRADQLSPEQLADTTFVFVSPHTWDHPKKKIQDYEKEIRKSFKWKGFKLIDGTQLESWLEQCPAVASRFAKYDLGKYPREGVLSIEQYWEEYSSLMSPALTESVLLCDREQQAANLVNTLIQGPATTVLAADSPDEVIAFAIAAIRSGKPEVREFLEARTLVVETDEAVRSLTGTKGHVFLPRGQARVRAGLLSKIGATLVAYGGDQPNRNFEVLNRPTSSSLGKAIATMGFTEEKAYELARSCGRSVTILARMIPGGAAVPPEWQDSGPDLLPALLAGGWSADSALDKQIVSDLASGQAYVTYEGKLQRFTRASDPPIDRVLDVWKMRAPVDAFVHLGHLIGAGDLARLREAATAVFSAVKEAPDPDAPFKLKSERPDTHTEWLRDGLATTLLQIAVLHKPAGLHIPGGAQAFVDEVVAGLPGLKSDHRLLSSLSAQLPILAEAAPVPLLVALEQMLEGEGKAIRPIFDETPGFLGSDSHHTGLLWALETIAWDPSLLVRCSLVLAKLAAIDPGGKLSNRPINSLRAIHVSWAPNTHAPYKARIASLDAIIEQVPEIAWDLLKLLLPKHHDTSAPTAKPRHRDEGEAQSEVLTYAIVWQTQREVVSRAISLARTDARRLAELVQESDQFEPAGRCSLYSEIESFLRTAEPEGRFKLITAVQKHANHHRSFAEAEWAMKADELAELDKIVASFPINDAVLRNKWLFDDWLPDVAGPFETRQEVVKQLRKAAIREIFTEFGQDGLIRLAQASALPHFVAASIVGELSDEDLFHSLLRDSSLKAELDQFSAALSSSAGETFGASWIDHLRSLRNEGLHSAEQFANLLVFMPDNPDVWQFAVELGPDIERIYWTRKPVFSPKGDAERLRQAMAKYALFGRPIAAIEVAHGRYADVDPQFLLQLLDESVSEINANGTKLGTMFVYHIEQLFAFLAKRTEIPDLEVARREYSYLSILQRTKSPLRIHAVLASDPEFYVSVLTDVYKGRSAGSEEVSKDKQERARVGYQLLSTFRTLPGELGDGIALRNWIAKVLELARSADRDAVAQLQIGNLLAHTRDEEDDAWPPEEVAAIIEDLKLDDLERGIEIERFNMRGVFSKGLQEGGAQERALAKTYRSWAEIRGDYPRTTAMLKRIASNWDRHGEHSDDQSKLDQLRF